MKLAKDSAFFGFVLTVLSMLAGAAELPVPAPPTIEAGAWLLVDANSGRVLASHNEHEHLEPASITKLMNSYVVFSELAVENISMDDEARVSENAYRSEGSRMFIEINSNVSVEDLLRGLIVQSGNDASIALAEFIAGTEGTFAELMNQHAAELGMTGTHYVNSTGLPDPDHYTTAQDIATLAAATIRNFPDYYPMYAEKEFTYNGIKQHNRNSLLWRDEAYDGLKTGHTTTAGYCLVSSAQRGDMRLIAVVLNAASEKARTNQSEALMNYGFRFFETHKLYSAGQEIGQARIWKGAVEQAAVAPTSDLYITIPRGRYDQLSAQMDLDDPLIAPLSQTDIVGTVTVSLGEEMLMKAPLQPTAAVELGGLLDRTIDTVKLWFE